MFARIVTTLFWISFMAALAAGSYLFMVDGMDSHFCRSVRWLKTTAPIAPFPSGFCGVSGEKGVVIVPPVVPKAVLTDGFFRQEPVYDDFDRQLTISINVGCLFDPATTEIRGETHVLWINDDTEPHEIVSAIADGDGSAGMEFSSPLIEPGQQYKLFVNRPGRYAYRCLEVPESGGEFRVRP